MSDLVMLAHEYKEHIDVNGWWITEKYDGVCGLFKQTDKTMWSRNGNKYSLPDFITEQLVSIGLDMHGEIWFGHNTFDICSGMARKDDTSDKMWENVTFMVFDSPDNGNLPLEDRIKKFKEAWISAGKPKNIQCVEFRKFDNKTTTIENELKKVENAGGEGLVLRKPGSKYEIKRSKNMLKVKSWIYKEAIVTGYNEGTGKYRSMVGALKIKNDEFGNFKVGSGLNDWQRGDTLDNPMDDNERREKRNKQNHSNNELYKKLINDVKSSDIKQQRNALRELNVTFTTMPIIGDVITFKYKETSKDGKPKFPTFVGVRNYE